MVLETNRPPGRLKERAIHNVTLPFTRYLAGHGDYTPVHFGARRGDTTWAHQIAHAAVFTAPLLTYGPQPASILKNRGVEMMKSISSTGMKRSFCRRRRSVSLGSLRGAAAIRGFSPSSTARRRGP
jgi:hypothetical protein